MKKTNKKIDKISEIRIEEVIDEENKENAANKVKITNDAGQVRLTAKMRAKEKELRRFAGVQRNRPLRQSEK